MNLFSNTLTLINGDIPVTIDYQQTQKASLILRALNHELRYQILKMTDEYQGAYVTQIHKRLQIERSVTSQHLTILRDAGIVEAIRDGNTIYYIPDYIFIAKIMELIGKCMLH